MKYKYLVGFLMLVLLIFITSAADTNYIDQNPKWKIKYFEYEQQIPVYKKECTDKVTYTNGTTHPKFCVDVLDKYKTKKVKTDKVIGITDGKRIVKNANKYQGKVIKWDIEIGNRNLKEYPGCRQYEIDKGVCHEI